jgi:hypothetical protein
MAKPEPGDRIYIETTLYVHHGEDDFRGGLCTVEAVQSHTEHGEESVSVEVKEDPGTWYRWSGYLEPNQEKWREEYGERIGHRSPDFRPEFNDDKDPASWRSDPDKKVT